MHKGHARRFDEETIHSAAGVYMDSDGRWIVGPETRKRSEFPWGSDTLWIMKGRLMRKSFAAVAISGMVFSMVSLPAIAQQGIVIENNGVSTSDSARGADSVNISRASGASSSNDGAGINNESGRVVKEKNRNRKDRNSRNNDGGEAVPADSTAAPAEGEYQAYTEDGEWVEPASAPEELVAETPAIDPNLPVQLPNTGVGSSLPLAPLAAAALSALMAVGSMRRRQPR